MGSERNAWRNEWNALPSGVREQWLNSMVLNGVGSPGEEAFRERAARALESLVAPPPEPRSPEDIAREVCSDIFILSVGSCPTLRDDGRDDIADALGNCVVELRKRVADALRADRSKR